MKRFIFPILWGTFVSLLLYPFFVFQQNTHAEGQLKRKVSKDILQKVSEGKGGEFVRVIIQPASQQDLSIDSTIEYSGSSNITWGGTGSGIAVLDSGIDGHHASFLNKSNGTRVVYNEDFTGEGRTDDPYGHGTHVASLAAGNGRISNGEFT